MTQVDFDDFAAAFFFSASNLARTWSTVDFSTFIDIPRLFWSEMYDGTVNMHPLYKIRTETTPPTLLSVNVVIVIHRVSNGAVAVFAIESWLLCSLTGRLEKAHFVQISFYIYFFRPSF